MKQLARIFALTVLIVGGHAAFTQQPIAPQPVVPVTAQATRPTTVPQSEPKPPVVPLQLQKDFFKAATAKLEAQHALEQTPQWNAVQNADNVLNGATNKIIEFCGAKFYTNFDLDGDPSCTVKTAPAAPSEPAK
jgi:hypothetical protein